MPEGNEKRKLQPGDLLWVERTLYKHCGIYDGDGYVIHFAAPDGSEINAENAVVHRTTFEHFRDGGLVKVIDVENCFPPDEIVRRARSKIGTKGYNLATFNCDHFATWCKTGEYRSMQVSGVKSVLKEICSVSKKIDNKIGTSLDLAVDIICKIHEIAESLKTPHLEEIEKKDQ